MKDFLQKVLTKRMGYTIIDKHSFEDVNGGIAQWLEQPVHTR